MAYASAWIFEQLLRLLLPSSGRHRSADLANGRPAVRHQDEPPPRTVRGPHAPTLPALAEYANPATNQLRAISGPPDGHEAAAMVRPYLVAHERQWEQQRRQERAERRLRRQRRRALWLAVHGVDVGPRLIHGVRVVA